MVSDVEIDELRVLAQSDRNRAHAEARRAVAENPESEEAAKHLRLIVAEFPPVPKMALPDALQDAASEVRRAQTLLDRGKEEEAEIILRQRLSKAPRDTAAMRMMAKIAADSGFAENSQKILERAIAYEPLNPENWVALGNLHWKVAISANRIELVENVLKSLDRAIELRPGHEGALSLKGYILNQRRRLDEAREAFETLLEVRPDMTRMWVNYAYLLKTLGDFGEAVAAYRMAVAMTPGAATSWVGLANLKLAPFFADDIEQMETRVDEADLEHRIELHFALADAYDKHKDYQNAARHLEAGNRLRLESQPHDAERVTAGVDLAIKTFTKHFFDERREYGCDDRSPIFIVSMPRAGSTLIEQILASHSMVEGTEELFIVHQLQGGLFGDSETDRLEVVLAETPLAELRSLGERYLEQSRYHRQTERPFFTDKNPANWRNVGFIRTILPNAKIIDARRDPMDCCFANYAHHYHWGSNFAYGLEELAGQYSEYVRLMRHFDEVAPGAIHRVINDELIDNFEPEVRRLLDFLGLPFEEQCLRFYETERAVHTPSSEQVRQPINRRGIGRWRNYEPWLDPLKSALGPYLEDWRR